MVALLTVMALGCPAVTPALERPRVIVHAVVLPELPDTDVAALEHRDDAEGKAEPERKARGEPEREHHVDIELGVTNPNAVTMEARALDWELELSDGDRVRGRTALSRSIVGGEQVRIHARLRVPASIARAARAALRQGAAGHRLSGTLHVFSSRGNIGVVFDEPVAAH